MRGKLQSILSIGTALVCLMALVGRPSVAQSADSERQVAFAAVDTGGEPAGRPTASAAVQTPLPGRREQAVDLRGHGDL